jgi:uncharacterized membrane protein YGL010W
MRPIQDWLDEYGESHLHPANKMVHWICVPLIVMSLVGLLWSIPVPAAAPHTPFANWAVLTMLAALFYYYMLAWRLALGMTVIFIVFAVLVYAASLLPVSLWLLSTTVFVLAWIGQFIGHKVEGKKPSFFKDLQFLLIGPLWLLAFLYRQANLRY